MDAPAGIPGYWIVKLVDQAVESFEGPSGSDCRTLKVVQLHEKVPVELNGKAVGEIGVAALFGE